MTFIATQLISKEDKRELEKVFLHFDKNKDGRANEAFVAVEEAREALSEDIPPGDSSSRSPRERYDAYLNNLYRHRRHVILQGVRSAVGGATRVIHTVTQRLGPMTLPTIVAVALFV